MKTLNETYDRDHVPMEEFAGVTLDDLYRVATTFQTNVCVYKLVKPDAKDVEDGKSTAELVRRSLCKYPETMYLNLHETHFSFTQDVRMYCHSYRCRKCGESLRKDAWVLYRHERTCTGGVHRVYPGGVYHSTPSVFERLDDENIRVAESLRYYPYRATFDFECWFDTEQLPSDSDMVHLVARHVPLSVSVASNVPGHERVQCLFTDNKLVSAMMDILQAMSDAAYDKIKHSYEYVLEQLAEELTKWDEREEAARSAIDKKKSRPATNPYKKLMGQLYGWMHQLPVIGFNSGKYDLNAIKQFLIPYFLSTTSKTGEQEEEQEQQDDLFNDLPEKTYFTIFNEKNKDLHHLVKDHVVGGASLIFHRYHEKGVTTLRPNEYGEAARQCRSIVGYDANALYLPSLMQDMPMGWYTRRREENDFRPE